MSKSLTILAECPILPTMNSSNAQSARMFSDNFPRIEQFLHAYGKGSSGYQTGRKPVAAFDWDNTVIKNDIGDATLFWMIANGKIRSPKSWAGLNPYLTAPALAQLTENCPTSEAYLPTVTSAKCADTLLSIYNNDTLLDGKTAAFAFKTSELRDTIKPAYALYAQLFSGYTEEEVRDFTRRALAVNLGNPIGATQTLGTGKYPAYIRIYDPMQDLIKRLQGSGFEVWVISASMQPTVEVMAKLAGISEDHVIGTRQVVDIDGRLTPTFKGCGQFPDGNLEILPFRKGKRCWLNQIVFGESDPSRALETPSPLAFAAGDAESDLFFLKDAVGLRLVINRNRPELMCHAYHNADGKWLVNPMFIEPLPRKEEGFHCHVFGLPDQQDRAFA